MVLALWCLIALHFFAFIGLFFPLLVLRLGTNFALIWTSIGLVLLFNIMYNHTLAMIVKPGSPKDLRYIENLRNQDK